MAEREAEQLIIIGNGFDLHCGLKSRFSDYLDYATSKIKNLLKGKIKYDPKISQTLLDEKNKKNERISPFQYRLSWWDLYFYELGEAKIKNWDDFEKQIEILVCSEENDNCLERLVKYFIPGQQIELPSDISDNHEYQTIISRLDTENLYNLIACLNSISKEKSNIQMMDILLDELKRLEKNLNDYLSMQLLEDAVKSDRDGAEKDASYREKYIKLIETISDDERYNLLSFNYTFLPTELEEHTDLDFPPQNLMWEIQAKSSAYLEETGAFFSYYGIGNDTNNKRCLFTLNTHGRLHCSFVKEENYISCDDYKNVDIITGIDSLDILPDEKSYKFTKTFRLFDEREISGNKCIQKSIEEIKFFGHSLAPADYSYFQAIFDFYHIYDSDTKLIFYYTDCRSKSEIEKKKNEIEKYIDEKIKEGKIYEGERKRRIIQRESQALEEEKRKRKANTVSAVIRLIEKYGETLDNKDHGRNLLHKLLLEGRLRIEYID